MSNNNLDNLEIEATSQEVEAKDTELAPKQQSPQNPADTLDPTGKARQAALAKVSEILVDAAKGHKINQKRLLTALKNLYFVCDVQSKIISGMAHNFQAFVQMFSNIQASLWTDHARQRAIIMLLEEKEIITTEELETIQNEKVIPDIVKEINANAQQSEPTLQKEQPDEGAALKTTASTEKISSVEAEHNDASTSERK